jgi:ubiquinone/menaquinone biosynthesis C-methylase UbiE
LSEYFERIWAAVPDGAEPEHLELRRDFLLERIARGDRVLDVGCGTGEFSAALLAAGAHPVGVDVAAGPLARAPAGLELVEYDGRELPFQNGSFDAVWAGEVLEHVQDVVGLVAEFRRVLRSGGMLLVSTPDHPRRLVLRLLRRRAFEQHFDPRADHVRFFTRGSLATLLEGFGELEICSRSGVLLASAVRP